MSDFFLHSFNTLSHGLIGYIIPFLFVLTIVVFFHELGHFLVARWAGVKVLTFSLGFGPELAGFNDRHGTRWKISAIPLGGYVKFFGDESEASTPSSEALASMTRGGARGQLPSQEGRTARGDRRRRSDREFHSGDRDLYRPVHIFRQAEHDRAGRHRGGRQCGRRSRLSSRRRGHCDRRQWHRELLRHAADRRNSRRREANLHGQARRFHAAIARHAGAARRSRTISETCTGSACSVSPARPIAGDVVTERVNPATALWLGVKETWFVVDRTLAYIGGRLHRAGSGRPGRRSATDRQDFRAGRHHRGRRPGPSGRRAFDFDRTAQPVSGPAARWRSPFVLCGRSRPRTAAVGTGAGDGVPDRAGSGADADGVCDLQRHPASGRVLKRLFCRVANGQRLGMKLKLHCERPFAAPAKLATSGQQMGICRFVGVRAGSGITRARCA